MKKKYIVMALLALGIILVCLSFVLTFNAMSNVHVIGGAGWDTFSFIFFHKNGGIYSTLTYLGVISIISSIVVGLIKKKNK
ncbi:MAG: hypothetical protein E7266_05345 [Lachnospiraceae bacterium]|nr:hypothetical protein [Lachnospiraceae bacterium]